MKAISALMQSKPSIAIRAIYSPEELSLTKSGKTRRLFSNQSHKFDMKNGKKIITKGMYLAPSDEAGYGINTCKNATKICRGVCLKYTGKLALPVNAEPRILKTRYFYAYPIQFLNQLIDEMKKAAISAEKKGETIQFRLNGTSDINWENYLHMDRLIEDIPALTKFYDYTKNPSRSVNPDHYHLTFSISDRKSSITTGLEYLEKGQSVAVVTSKTEKAAVMESGLFVDGDLSDHRPQDPKGSIVLLAFKGKGATKHQRGTDDGFIKSAASILKLAAQKTGILHARTEVKTR